MSEGLGDHGLPHADGPVQDDRLARLDEPECGQITDLGGRNFGVEREVVLLDRGRLLEAGRLQPALEAGGVAPGCLVAAQGLEQLDVPQFAGVGLGQPGLERLQHAEELQLAELVLQVMGRLHSATSISNRPSGPCRWAGADGGTSGCSSPSCSVPATRMPLTVL